MILVANEVFTDTIKFRPCEFGRPADPQKLFLNYPLAWLGDVQANDILSSLLIACGIFGALYSLAQTHSGWSFIFLCAVMAIAITATASWYIAEDQPPPPPITPPSS
jgi:hypothetical protein